MRRGVRLAGAFVVLLWIGLQGTSAWIAAHPPAQAEPDDPPAGTCWERIRTGSNATTGSATGDAWWCPGAAPAVVVTHGYGGDRTLTLPLATAIRERTGHAVVLVRLPYTDGALPYSGGARESEAVRAALETARERTGTEAVALGISAGGNATIRAVASGAPARAVIADSAFMDSAAVFAIGASRLAALPPLAWVGMRVAFPVVSGGGALGSTDLTGWTTPTLAITCRADVVVPLDQQQRLVEGTGAEQWMAPCDDHVSAWDTVPDAYLDHIAATLTPSPR